MGLIRSVARRFVFDRQSGSTPDAHGFVSFIAAISMSGLALGVTALLVVTSVINGFERELKGALTAFHGHILMFSRAEPLTNPRKYLDEIPRLFPEVRAISPYIFSEVMLSSAKGVSGAVIEGVDLPTLDGVSQVGKKLTAGRLPEAGKGAEIALGAEIARKLHVGPGDSVVLTVPFAKATGEEGEAGAPLVRKLSVVGIVKLGMYDYDSKYSLMELAEFQKILSLEGKVNAFKIVTRDAARSLKTTNAINDKYVYPLRARDWSSLNRNLFYAISHQKAVIGVILTAIVLVASFNIISTLIMMVHDKKRQISMLRALGWGRRQTMGVFLYIGLGMAVLGTALGAALGRALCGLVEWKSIIDLPPDIYSLARLPVEIRGAEWIAICVMTILLALGATLWPSLWVTRESPVEGLRHE